MADESNASGSAGQSAPAAGVPPIGGSVGNPPAGAPPSGTPPPSNNTPQVGVGDFREYIPEEFKTADFWKSVKDTPDLVKQFAHAQKLVGANKVVVPGDGAQPADWDAFYNKMGRPESHDKYAVPNGPDGKPLLDKETADDFRDAAFKAGLSQRQFAAMTSLVAERVAAENGEHEAATKQSLSDFSRALHEQHGEKLPAILDQANRALTALGDEKLTELLTADERLANHPSVINLLNRVATLMGEDTLRATGVSPSAHSSAGTALNALKQFESENSALLFHKNPEMLPFSEQSKRKVLIEERGRLFKSAYPSF